MFPIISVRSVDFETAFNYEPTSAPTIDLFSLYLSFSHCRSCDNNLEDYFIQIHFILTSAYVHIICEKSKGGIPLRPSKHES